MCVCECVSCTQAGGPAAGGRGRHLSPAQKEVTLKGYGNDRDSAALQQRTAPLAKQIMLQGAIQTLVIMVFFVFRWCNTRICIID